MNKSMHYYNSIVSLHVLEDQRSLESMYTTSELCKHKNNPLKQTKHNYKGVQKLVINYNNNNNM